MACRKAKTLFLKTKCFMHFYVWLVLFNHSFAGISPEININQWQGSDRTEDGPVMDGHNFSLLWSLSFRNDYAFPFLFVSICCVWTLLMSDLGWPLLYIWGPEKFKVCSSSQLVSGRFRLKSWIISKSSVHSTVSHCETLYVNHCECLINTRF